MHELMRTNNAVLITAVEALLKGAGIPHFVLDQHMSVMEGSLGLLPRRIMVDEEDRDSARRLLVEAGLAHELRLQRGPPREPVASPETTDDAVLGGRLRLIQPRNGHRVGHDAILLAAATPAEPGGRAVDLGAGVGAAGLALAVRLPRLAVTLVEREPELVAMAQQNIARNDLADRARALALDVNDPPDAFARFGLEPGCADDVLMNPPFNDASRQNASPQAARRSAHMVAGAGLSGWIGTAARLLRDDGRLTLIWRADGLADVLSALAPGFGAISILPIHGKAGQPAIRIIVRGRLGARSPLTLLPALHLNDSAGRPTAEAEAVLRELHALPH